MLFKTSLILGAATIVSATGGFMQTCKDVYFSGADNHLYATCLKNQPGEVWDRPVKQDMNLCIGVDQYGNMIAEDLGWAWRDSRYYSCDRTCSFISQPGKYQVTCRCYNWRGDNEPVTIDFNTVVDNADGNLYCSGHYGAGA